MTKLATFSGRRASQNHYELTSFVDLMTSRGVKSYLEIGARHGDTFHYVMSALPTSAKGVAVDFNGGAWGKKGTDHSLNRAKQDLLDKGYNVQVIYGDSTSMGIRHMVMSGMPYDAILIDGDHRLPGVTADYRNYTPMAKPGGLVAFHDIVGSGQQDSAGNRVEVPLLWQSLRSDYNNIEFVDENSTMGIGVIFV